MAIKTTVKTNFGEERDVYLRINNVETSNHGVESTCLFRGYISKEAFECGSSYVCEMQITMIVDQSKNIWEQFYDELKGSLNSFTNL